MIRSSKEPAMHKTEAMPLPITAAGVLQLAEMREREAAARVFFEQMAARCEAAPRPDFLECEKYLSAPAVPRFHGIDRAAARAALAAAQADLAAVLEHKDAAPAREHTQFALEVKRTSDNAGEMTFSGYGAVFDNVDSYGDVITKGAFADTLARAKSTNDWPVMLLQHGGWGMGAEDVTPIGIWTAMEEDNIGLKIEGKFADTPRGREAYALLKMTPRPAITGLSIGYIAKEWEMRSRPEEPRRTLKKVDLLEVSLVTFPANPKARVQSVKSGADIRELERLLCDAGGLTRSEAKTLLSRGYKAMEQDRQRDADPSPRDAGEEADLQQLAALFLRGHQALIR
jgi:HK97 family phage prohead protease